MLTKKPGHSNTSSTKHLLSKKHSVEHIQNPEGHPTSKIVTKLAFGKAERSSSLLGTKKGGASSARPQVHPQTTRNATKVAMSRFMNITADNVSELVMQEHSLPRDSSFVVNAVQKRTPLGRAAGTSVDSYRTIEDAHLCNSSDVPDAPRQEAISRVQVSRIFADSSSQSQQAYPTSSSYPQR